MANELVEEKFKAALEALVEQVKQDRSILAAILCGSLSHDKVWARSDIDLVLVTIDDKKVAAGDLALYADGLNVHTTLVPRAEFRKTTEGAIRNSFLHALLAKGRLLFTHDETITDLCARLGEIGDRDTQVQLLRAATHALGPLYKAHKWLITRGDLDYTALWILYVAAPLAKIEVIGRRLIADREAIPQAMKLNPAFFKTVYVDLLNAKKTRKNVQAALDAIDRYLAERATTLFEPLIDHLREVGEARSSSEIESHFQRHFDVSGITIACEYLADQGLIGKASTPVQLTRRSNVDVQELAFFYLEERANGFQVDRQAEFVAGRGARTTIAVQGARVHNLKNISVEIPRDKLIVVTGLSGSGKSSLAFDTIYAEGQRRYMESLSSFAKRFVAQVAKPDVDFVFGLSPVISIEQKTIASNPRSTVGTMTDISSYLNLLFATIGRPQCPRTGELTPSRSASQILEAILSLPEGAEIELRAPVFKVYGEELDFVFTEVRKKGCRRLIIDGRPVDISEQVELDETSVQHMDAVVDRLVVNQKHEKAIKAAIAATLLVGDGLLQVEVVKGANTAERARFYQGLCSATHHFVYGDIGPEYFVFNLPESACRTCGGLGIHKRTHPELLVPDPRRSIRGGCFVREAFKYNPETWDGRVMYSLAKTLGFSLDTPWEQLPESARQAILGGIDAKRIVLSRPPDAKGSRDEWEGKEIGFGGIAMRIERRYRRYRQKGEANSGMEAWLDNVMVEHTCPDCKGARVRATRLCFTIEGKTIHELGQLNFDELHAFLGKVKPTGRGADAGRQVLKEIRGRLELLLGIGLDYLNLGRRSGTLSGGESQRIRLSTQIGSGLMGMLYVLDEPSIGLHPKDNVKMIATLESLRDIGNTVIVVEHDEDTIRAADHLVEMGPGPGVHGGRVVVQGTLANVLACKASPTGQFLSGKRSITTPKQRRKGNGKALTVRGARENNLKAVDVAFPLGMLVAITGASGSGKSTLVKEVLYKALWKRLVDTRTLPGEHERVDGTEHVHKVVNIDQSPIGRNSRSNPATYIGFYDAIRDLFTQSPLSLERGYKPGRFSFNVKGGRCEECQGEGVITTQLYFMPDVEVTCGACKGARFNSDTLEVTLRGKTIDDVLNMSVEEGAAFFAGEPVVGKKIEVLDELGLGYLTLGQSATTLSGGEAQRIKVATELSKLQRSKHTLYILDEPTTGLHLADVQRLLESLNRLVDTGHTVLLIEHHLDVIKTADHVIDLGPEGGHEGGHVVVTGTPEEVAACKASHTGSFLKKHLQV